LLFRMPNSSFVFLYQNKSSFSKFSPGNHLKRRQILLRRQSPSWLSMLANTLNLCFFSADRRRQNDVVTTLFLRFDLVTTSKWQRRVLAGILKSPKSVSISREDDIEKELFVLIKNKKELLIPW